MAATVYYRTALTGGASNALDAADGADLVDGDPAFVFANGIIYPYILDADSGLTESSPDVIAPDTNAGDKRWILQHVPATSDIPVGSIVPWVAGYFTNGANAGYTAVLAANTISDANTLLNPDNWYVCDGSALNTGTGIFNGTGRYLPNLTDDRFIQGDTTAGGTGGASTMAHVHAGPSHTHTGPNHLHSIPAHTHVLSISTAPAGGSGIYAFTNANVEYKSAFNSHYSGTGATGAAGTGNTGAASETENRPKFLSCLYIMKVQ